MNKYYKVLFLLLLLALVLWGNADVLEAQDKPVPRIFFPEPIHDFGAISRGGSVSHVFAVQNIGSGPLELLGVKDT